MEDERNAKIAAAEKALNDYQPTFQEKYTQWLANPVSKTQWTTMEAQSLKSQIGTELSKEADGAIFASGKNGKDTFTIVTETDLKNLTAIRLEALTDKRLPRTAPDDHQTTVISSSPNSRFMGSERQAHRKKETQTRRRKGYIQPE